MGPAPAAAEAAAVAMPMALAVPPTAAVAAVPQRAARATAAAAAEAALVTRPAGETPATIRPSVVDEGLEEGEAFPRTRQTTLVVGGARNISFQFKPPSKETVCTVDQRARTRDGEGRRGSAPLGQTAQRPAAMASEDQSQQKCKPPPISNADRLRRAAAVAADAAIAAAAEADGAEATAPALRAGEPREAASGQCSLPKTTLAAGSRQDDGPFAEEVEVDVVEVS